MNNGDYKKKFDFERRLCESERVMTKYEDKIPCIIEKSNNSNTRSMDKNKYLIHKDILISQLIFLIRKRIRLSHEESLYIFINDTIPQTTKLISEIYSEHKDEDGFLYIVYSCENTFGNL